jgi:SWI/SNF-related matrix-associated actin-dependent regulator of chromatin subfamily B protein 1
LELEIGGVKIRDAFTWNINETLITPEQFAAILIDDLAGDLTADNQTISQIGQTIRNQIESWEYAVNSQEEEMDIPESKESFSESRTIIKLDLQVGSLHLQDQFEWPLMPEVHRDGGVPYPSPESFAQQLCSDIGIGGEFVSLISHNIREQLYNARLNYEEVPKTNDLEIFRDDVHLESWGPTVRDVDEDEIEKNFKPKSGH